MKEKFIDLQLFADDAATEAAVSIVDESNADVTETKPENSEVKSAKATSKELKYSDDDLDEIIGKKFAKWQAQQQKAVDEAQKLATMNATQKAEYERNQLKKELDELKKQAALSEMTKVARKMLSDDGITASDELLAPLVTTDAETTKAAVDSFKTIFKEEVENAVKERLRGETPKVGIARSTSPISEVDKRIKKYE